MNPTLADSFVSTLNATTCTAADKLTLLSPITWRGIFDVLTHNPFGAVDVLSLKESLLGIALPAIFLSVLQIPRKYAPILFVSSPWIWGSVGRFWTVVKATIKTLKGYHRLRFRALSRSFEVIQDRIQSGRAQILKGGHYLFFPEVSTLSSSSQKRQHAILLIPGALCPHISYSSIASKLSDQGIMVVVVNLEPTRLANCKLNTSHRRIRRIQRQVEEQLSLQPLTWSLAGHSMGTFPALELAMRIPDIHSVVCWGMSMFPSLVPDLPKQLSKRRASTRPFPPMLLIRGSDDNLFGTIDTSIEDKASAYTDHPLFTRIVLPESQGNMIRIQILEGGSHDCYGDYETMIESTEEQRETQQLQASNYTASFIYSL